MKKILFSTMIASLLAFVGCRNEELVNETTDTGNGKKVTLTATIAGTTDSRVALNEVNEYDEKYGKDVPTIKVNWKVSDEIFTVYNADYSGKADFTQDSGNEFTSKDALPDGIKTAYYGNYIFSNSALSYDLSSQDGTLNENYILMQAPVTDGSSNITFEHRTAILKVEFKGVNNQDVTKIVMGNVHTGSNNESITVTPTQASLGYFYIFLPIENESAYVGGDTFHFTVTADGKEYTGSLTIPTGMSIMAGKLYTATIALTEVIPYVTFRAASTQTLDLEQTKSQELDEWGNFVYEDDEETIPVLVPNPYPGVHPDTGYIEYSVGDSDTWTKFTKDTDPVAFGGEKGDLRLRGISPNGTLQAQIVFGDRNIYVACSGDIRTLVDWKYYATADTDSAIFQGLFKDCSVLTSAPALPATTLAPYCYYRMFEECTSLETAPALPATTLAAYCYKSMFNGCTGLINAPVLPAPTLANECYGMMFHGCAKLTAAPELPATNLAADCYNGMFAGCSELTSAPALPATTLANNCYISMFARCSKLTSAPALPATTLTSSCYYNMFNGCTSLNSVTMLATDIPENGDCLTTWMSGVPAGGTFTKHKDMTSLPTGASGIPSDWTVQDYVAPGEGN